MPRRHKKNRGGGFFDSVSNSFSGLFGSKKTTPSYSTSYNSYSNPTSSGSYSNPTYSSSYSNPTSSGSYFGGKRRRSRKHMRGGYTDNTPTTGLAAHASPFSGPTAQPHNWLGGRTRRYGRKGGKTRRHRKH